MGWRMLGLAVTGLAVTALAVVASLGVPPCAAQEKPAVRELKALAEEVYLDGFPVIAGAPPGWSSPTSDAVTGTPRPTHRGHTRQSLKTTTCSSLSGPFHRTCPQ